MQINKITYLVSIKALIKKLKKLNIPLKYSDQKLQYPLKNVFTEIITRIKVT
jgi:hypothetical protein